MKRTEETVAITAKLVSELVDSLDSLVLEVLY